MSNELTRCLVACAVAPTEPRTSRLGGWVEVDGRAEAEGTTLDPRLLEAVESTGTGDLTRHEFQPHERMALKLHGGTKTAPTEADCWLEGADVWTWRHGPDGSPFAVAVVACSIDLQEAGATTEALKALALRWKGGRVEAAGAKYDGDVADALAALGLTAERTQAVTLWQLGWSRLCDEDHRTATVEAQACGEYARSSDFVRMPYGPAFLTRDGRTPADRIDSDGVAKITESGPKPYGNFAQSGSAVLAYACAQRVGLDLFRSRFAGDLAAVGSTDFRERYRQWLQFRHRFPLQVHLDSKHMRLLYADLQRAYGTVELAQSVDEEHRLSMQLERDVSTDETTRAVYSLTMVTGALALFSASLMVVDGLRNTIGWTVPALYGTAFGGTLALTLLGAWWLHPSRRKKVKRAAH